MEVGSIQEFDAAANGAEKPMVVAYFWAGFHEACKKGGQLDQVIDLLSKRHANVGFVKVDAENLSELAEKYGVSMVPSFVFIKKGQKVDLLEGANPANLQTAIERNLQAGAPGAGSAQGKSGENPTVSKIKRLIQSSHVLLFMKGTASEPKCKFSREMVEILNEHKVKFATFDILSDEDLRSELKTYSNWQTYPQLYIGGKLLGGLDSVKELIATDGGQRLRAIISENIAAPPRVAARPPAPERNTAVVDDAYLSKLVSRAPVMVFMKGSPEEPSCGFSAKIVKLLKESSITFSSFDILENLEVREKLKTFANWPTYPQLWVGGKLIGGLDIVTEMAEDGDLAEQLGIEPIQKRLEALVKRAPVMLFMKGTPAEPRCGFSRQIVGILDEAGSSYDSFNILEDEEVRQGLKDFSNWPTYPQLYIGGKLIGGLDIVKELKEEDELHDILASATSQL